MASEVEGAIHEAAAMLADLDTWRQDHKEEVTAARQRYAQAMAAMTLVFFAPIIMQMTTPAQVDDLGDRVATALGYAFDCGYREGLGQRGN